VGSVTKIQKSLPLTDSTTGQDVPGGASIITVFLGLICSLTWRISGGDIASPILSLP